MAKIAKLELMSKTHPVKFLDEFILPAVVVVGTKYISVFLVAAIFSYSWKPGFHLFQIFSIPFVEFANQQSLIVVNSISSLVTSLVLAAGFTWVFFRMQYFHEDFLPPKVSSKLYQKKMEFLIISDREAAHQVTAWFLIGAGVFLLNLLGFLAGNLVLFVLVISTSTTFFLSTLTILDMTRKGSSLHQGRR